MSEQFVATLRVGFAAEDEVSAHIIAEGLQEQVMEELDEEDLDFCQVTQIISFTARDHISHQEICDVLRRDRNILIRTRVKDLWDIARSLDETIHRITSGFDDLALYDYGHFIEVATKVLAGENPVD